MWPSVSGFPHLHHVFLVRPGHASELHSSLWPSDVPVYGQPTFCLSVISGWPGGCFHFLATVSNASVTIHVHVFVLSDISISSLEKCRLNSCLFLNWVLGPFVVLWELLYVLDTRPHQIWGLQVFPSMLCSN